MLLSRKKEEVQNPSMIVVGEVVRYRDKIQWFEQQTSKKITMQAGRCKCKQYYTFATAAE
ncbi:hypothetical protein GCM10020331_068840 [Ectobacillus funiculus]